MKTLGSCRLVVAGLAAAVALTGCGGNGGGGADPGDGAAPSSAGSNTGTSGATLNNIFFLHHSVGDGLIVEGGVRAEIAAENAAHGTALEFWDHGYNWEGLRDPSGSYTGTSYEIPGDDTDVWGVEQLWTSQEAEWVRSRNLILDNHGVIAFKSCFPNAAIPDGDTLAWYQQVYLTVRDVFDAHPEHRFIVMPPPPLHRLSTSAGEAANARAFANWLCSDDYVAGHNVSCFNLFDHLAAPDDGSAAANTLRHDYEMAHSDGDSHPNVLANATVGPVLARFFCTVARGN